MFAPRKAIWCVRRRKSFYPIGTPTSRRGAGGERKAPCWHDKRQLCRRNSPWRGLTRRLRRSWRWAGLSLAGWDAFLQLGHFCSADKRADFLFPQSAVDRLIPCRLGCFGVSYIFLQRKRPAGFQIHAGLVKRTMRPVTEWRSVLCNWQGAIPDPRAARPSAERR